MKHRNPQPWMAVEGVMRHGRHIKAGFVKPKKTQKHNPYSILTAQRSENESPCAPRPGGAYGPNQLKKPPQA